MRCNNRFRESPWEVLPTGVVTPLRYAAHFRENYPSQDESAVLLGRAAVAMVYGVEVCDTKGRGVRAALFRATCLARWMHPLST